MSTSHPTTLNGHPVPLDPRTGLPDVNDIVGLAASVISQCDFADAEARSWTDALNATGQIVVSTDALRRLVDAAVPAAVTEPAPCWCGAERDARVPADADGLGCTADVMHANNVPAGDIAAARRTA